MLLKVELPKDYPNSAPFVILKNLSPEYLDNRMLDEYETEMRKHCNENLGMQMIFDICEICRERIGDINDKVLNKYNAILEA